MKPSTKQWVEFALQECLRFFGVLFLIILLLAGWVYYLLSPSWPRIADRAVLRHEATLLYQNHSKPEGEVGATEWPPSIATLHPRRVFKVDKKIIVMISAGGTTGLSWGFYIWPEGVDRPDGGITKYDAAKEDWR